MTAKEGYLYDLLKYLLDYLDGPLDTYTDNYIKDNANNLYNLLSFYNNALINI
jgi:hypothetical protein